MEKRAVGTPLTEAERKQRQDAARARWAHRAAGAALGATAGLSLAQAAIQRKAASNLQTILNAYDAARQPEIERHRAKDAQIVLNGLRAEARVKSGWPVPAMRAALFQDKRNASAKLREAEDAVAPLKEHEDLVRQSLASDPPVPEEALGDIWSHMREFRHSGEVVADLSAPARALQAAQQRIDEMAGAKKARTVQRAGRTYQISPHTRVISRGIEVREKFREQLEQFNRDLEHDMRSPPGEEILNWRRGVPKPPRSWFTEIKREVEVKPEAGAKQTAPHRVRVPGSLDAKRIRAMRTELIGRIQAHTAIHRAAEELRHHQLLRDIRPEIVTRWQPSRRFKLLALGAGAIGGALTGLAAEHAKKKFEKAFLLAREKQPLAKVNEVPDDEAANVAGVPEGAEDNLARNIASTLRTWKDDAAANLNTPSGQTLHDRMVSDLERATRPIEGIMDAGAGTPIPAVVPGENGGGHTILVSMGARGPEMERFLRDYREDRITALADDQRATIRGILIDAARAGSSPDEMARKIRETIGLTPGQAQAVLRYRDELENLSSGALSRALRDKRFDSVIQRAVDEGNALTPAQINRAVDAYHRRMLAYRSMVIARTEGVGAANNAHIASVIPFLSRHPAYTVVKTWNTKLDGRERHDHHGLHGKSVVGLYTPFVCDSGAEIRWPHDPQAAANEVIQCRCALSLQLVPRTLAARLGPQGARDFAAGGNGRKPAETDGNGGRPRKPGETAETPETDGKEQSDA